MDINKLKQLRKQVLARDGNRCTKCGRMDEPLQVHHRRGGTGHVDDWISVCVRCYEIEKERVRGLGVEDG